MKNATVSSLFAIALLGLAGAANAACYADYKAKRDNPLRLHYGVIELPDAACADPSLSRAEIVKRIAESGWQLLNVLSIFDETGLGDKKASAGKFFLRF
jgi:hypothetical protein